MANPYDFLHKFTVLGSAITLSEHAIRSISQTLSMVERGSLGNVLTTPFMGDHSQEEVISALDNVIYDRLSQLELPLTELELLSRSKIAPRSEAKPWKERRDDVLRYFSFPWPDFNVSDFKVVRSSGTLRPIKAEAALEYLLNNTSSGLPYMRRKGLVKEEALANLGELLASHYPSMLFTRTQEAKKTRAVWGIPIGNVIKEQMFFRPLHGVMSKVGWRSALRGPDAVNEGITRIILDAKSKGNHLVSIDFSSYDQSVGPGLSTLAFDFIARLYQSSFRPEVYQLAETFRTIPLITPDGVIGCSDPMNPELRSSLKEHGVPSGSSFTNEVDSIVQHLISMKSGALESAEMSQIQGDDGAYSVRSPSQLVEGFEKYGLVVNRTKSYTSKEFLIYLQNYFSGGYVNGGRVVGIYPLYRALGRLMYLERFTDLDAIGISGSDFFSIRAITILENCKWHPFFYDFVKFVAEWDKKRLKFTDAGLLAFVRASESKGSQEVKHRHGDYVRGLKNFETFKILAKL